MALSGVTILLLNIVSLTVNHSLGFLHGFQCWPGPALVFWSGAAECKTWQFFYLRFTFDPFPHLFHPHGSCCGEGCRWGPACWCSCRRHWLYFVSRSNHSRQKLHRLTSCPLGRDISLSVTWYLTLWQSNCSVYCNWQNQWIYRRSCYLFQCVLYNVTIYYESKYIRVINYSLNFVEHFVSWLMTNT